MPITLNRKNHFSFLSKKKENSLNTKIPTSSSSLVSELTYNNLNESQENDHDYLINDEDIYTIKTNGNSTASSSFIFPSPTLTAITKENEDIPILEDVVDSSEEEKEIHILSSLPPTLSFLKKDDDDVHHHFNLLKKSSNGLYSNFYLKLPNGKWLVKVRTRERKILGTFELDNYMI